MRYHLRQSGRINFRNKYQHGWPVNAFVTSATKKATMAQPQRYFDSDDGSSSNDSDTSFVSDGFDSDDDETRVVRGVSPRWPDHVSGLALMVGIVMALRFNPEWWA